MADNPRGTLRDAARRYLLPLFHSARALLDGDEYSVVVYLSRHEPGGRRLTPHNVAEDLTQEEADALCAALERAGDRLCIKELFG
jgi:hypothetical protein